jgi:hypothetical protein
VTIYKRQNFSDESSDIPKNIPKEAREISVFFSLVIDETMEKPPSTLTSTGIRCFRKRCTGVISTEVLFENNKIHWKCSECRNEWNW